MTRWIHLPTEILINIFSRFETIRFKPFYSLSNKIVMLPTKDLLRFQLTCKSWSAVVRLILYKSVLLNSSDSIDKFLTALTYNKAGFLVKNIFINCKTSPKFFIWTVPSLVYQCPNLRSIFTSSFLTKEFWETINIGRSRGFLTKLETMPYIRRILPENGIKEYNAAAFQLRQTLREIMIHDEGVDLYKNELSCFSSIETICFKYTKYTNIFTIDQQIKNCLSIKCVSIIYENNNEQFTVNNIINPQSVIHASSHAKCLHVSSSRYTYQFYKYIFKTFPDLETVVLSRKLLLHNQVPLSATEVASLLHYLTNIPSMYASFYCSGKQTDILLGLYDKNYTIQRLTINCKPIEAIDNERIHLIMSANTKNELYISISFREGPPPGLPRTGLIEKSGCNLQYLKINMNLSRKELILLQKDLIGVDGSHYTSLSIILYQCPKLRDLLILRTFLYDFGNHIQFEQKKRVYGKVAFIHCMIGLSFLPNFSYHVSYISSFYIKDCHFVDMFQSSDFFRTPKVIYTNIDMSNTEFGDISYHNYANIDRVHLALLKAGDSQPTYHYEKIDLSFKNNEPTLSIFIKCVDVRKVIITTSKFQFCFDF